MNTPEKLPSFRVGRPRGVKAPMSSAERQAAARWRINARGGRQITVFLDPDARIALQEMMGAGNLPTQNEAISVAVRYLAQQVKRGLRRVDL